MTTGRGREGALRGSLVAGAAYDLVLGAFILAAGPAVLAALGAPVPPGAFHLRLAALPLLVLPALYLAAARAPDPGPFRFPVLWARSAGGAILLLLALAARPGAAWLYLVLGSVDLGWGVLHAVLWPRPGPDPATGPR